MKFLFVLKAANLYKEHWIVIYTLAVVALNFKVLFLFHKLAKLLYEAWLFSKTILVKILPNFCKIQISITHIILIVPASDAFISRFEKTKEVFIGIFQGEVTVLGLSMKPKAFDLLDFTIRTGKQILVYSKVHSLTVSLRKSQITDT